MWVFEKHCGAILSGSWKLVSLVLLLCLAWSCCQQADCVLLTYAHHFRWSIGHQQPPAIALCSGLLWSFRTSWSPAVSALLQFSPPTVTRPASLPLPFRVPGQGLACGAGCWLPEGVSDPAPLPPQYLLGHWFLSHSLPQIFISDLLLPLDFVDAPQTGVEEWLNLLLRLCVTCQ